MTTHPLNGPFQPTVESLSTFEVPEWFRDAKLGIWAHWGPQSVPRLGDWYARHMYREGSEQYRHHVRTYGHPSRFGYKDIVALWKAENFDPEALMDRYVAAGARYFVALAVHHDNFLNYDSALHRWNSAKVGPGRDLVAEWREAALKRGLRFGISEHLGASFSWFATNKGADQAGPYKGVPYDGTDPAYEDLYLPNQEHYRAGDEAVQHPWYTSNAWWHQRWLDLVTEMIDRFQPDLLYTDGSLPFESDGHAAGARAVAHLYNTSAAAHGGVNQAVYTQKTRDPNLVRVGVLDVERSQEPDIRPDPWQTDTCVGNWFYDSRCRYKTPGHVLEILVDVVAKNGNLLLNIPLRPDGTLDDECSFLLDQMARWMSICGEGIFGTRPFRVFGEGPSRVVIDGFREDRVDWTPQDFRFTQRGSTVYAFLMRWPSDRTALIRTFTSADRVRSVRLLGHGDVEWAQVEEGLRVRLPETGPAEELNCLAIQRAAR
ncbi:alpha-L-fucosidase [Thermasporomyces composti]|uniref:alpha-L-fucosidase n=1 Tax=Thermasporomyces composti TaxID=696763 RepID=A0A3D9VG94_THECX|nr:alpha-L-fucosidase [Thermasporomyces composti]REF37194.1 alpha-L-fucosidase [Thermasporomyces composti]